MNACSLLRLLLLTIPHLTTLGLEMKPSNISVKYSEENFGLRAHPKDRKISDRNR